MEEWIFGLEIYLILGEFLMRVVTKKSLLADREHYKRRIESTNSQIETLYKNIEKLEAGIDEYRKQIVLLDELEKELEMYEMTPISDRTLEAYVFSDTSTLALMDQFESLTEKGFKKYSRMILKNNYKYNNSMSYNFIIERRMNRETVGDITMTEFKQNFTKKLVQHANNEILNNMKNKAFIGKQDFMFNKCFLLRAQNSTNRTGYGNVYNGEDLVYAGTLYGETTSYVFAGVRLFHTDL